MPHHSNELDLPPEANKHDGSLRMIGFEMEFSGISLGETATVVQSALGGGSYSRNLLPNRVIQTDSFGKCIIELDLKQVLSNPESTMDGIFTNYLDHNVSRNRALDLPSYRVDVGYTVPLDGWLSEGDEFIHVHVHFIGDHTQAGLILLLVQCFIAQEGRRNFIRR